MTSSPARSPRVVDRVRSRDHAATSVNGQRGLPLGGQLISLPGGQFISLPACRLIALGCQIKAPLSVLRWLQTGAVRCLRTGAVRCFGEDDVGVVQECRRPRALYRKDASIWPDMTSRAFRGKGDQLSARRDVVTAYRAVGMSAVNQRGDLRPSVCALVGRTARCSSASLRRSARAANARAGSSVVDDTVFGLSRVGECERAAHPGGVLPGCVDWLRPKWQCPGREHPRIRERSTACQGPRSSVDPGRRVVVLGTRRLDCDRWRAVGRGTGRCRPRPGIRGRHRLASGSGSQCVCMGLTHLRPPRSPGTR